MEKLRFRPKLFDSLAQYNAETFRHDLVAGLTVGVVALPLAMAFGIATGVKPEQGIFTAIIAGFIISALGGSRVVIGGPTAAFIVILAGIGHKYGAANLAICTMMAGALLVIMGLARLGSIIKFIPYPLTMGFTCGIAVTIFGTQLKDFLGLVITDAPAEFIPKLATTLAHLAQAHLPTVSMAMACILLIAFWPKQLARWVPGSIAALVLATAVNAFEPVAGFGMKTIGSVFGGIPSSLPAFALPHVDWSQLKELLHPALTIALLAAIESLLCAVVADGMIDDRHDSNQELMAQGIANLVVPLFGGIAATGAIVRTATNVRNGARTPVAGIIHALTLLLILLVAAPLAKHIPMAALSAVLLVVAYNMGEWRLFSHLRRWPRSDMAVFLTAFGFTVVVDLTWAVIVGLLLAGALFIRRIAATTQITGEGADYVEKNGTTAPDGVVVFRIFGAFFFGAADKLEMALEGAQREPEVLVLQLREALVMDATGLTALEELHARLRRHGKHLILCGPHTQPLFALQKSGFIDRIGMENLCGNLDESFTRARVLMQARPVRA